MRISNYSKSMRRRWEDPDYRRKASKRLLKVNFHSRSRQISKLNRINWKNPTYRRKMLKVCSKAGSIAMGGLWKDQEFRKLMAKNFGRNPSKAALKLFYVLRLFGFKLEYPIGIYSIDIAYPPKKLAIEVDGKYWHAKRSRNGKRRRARFLRHQGWKVIRIQSTRIKRHRKECVSRCLASL